MSLSPDVRAAIDAALEAALEAARGDVELLRDVLEPELEGALEVLAVYGSAFLLVDRLVDGSLRARQVLPDAVVITRRSGPGRAGLERDLDDPLRPTRLEAERDEAGG